MGMDLESRPLWTPSSGRGRLSKLALWAVLCHIVPHTKTACDFSALCPPGHHDLRPPHTHTCLREKLLLTLPGLGFLICKVGLVTVKSK